MRALAEKGAHIPLVAPPRTLWLRRGWHLLRSGNYRAKVSPGAPAGTMHSWEAIMATPFVPCAPILFASSWLRIIL
jgi:hypothetical protein